MINLIDIHDTQAHSAEEARADWTLMSEDGVAGIVRSVARSFARDYGLTLEAEDAYQEAQILLATRSQQARAALAQGGGVLYRWLHQRLRDRFLTEAKRRSGHASFEAMAGGVAR